MPDLFKCEIENIPFYLNDPFLFNDPDNPIMTFGVANWLRNIGY